MFSKLLKDIGTNPSALDKFIFYSRKVKKNLTLRKWSIIVILVCIGIIWMLPHINTERSLKFSDQHLINGINSKNDIVFAYDNNQNVREIYTKFGINKQDIVNLKDKPTDIYSAEENSFWVATLAPPLFTNAYPSSQEKLQTLSNGETLFYYSSLSLWNKNHYSIRHASYEGRNSTTGEKFWILKDSGNYVQIGKTVTNNPPPAAELEFVKSVRKSPRIDAKTNNYQYIYEFQNSSPDSLAENVYIEDWFEESKIEVTSSSVPISIMDNKLRINLGDLYHSANIDTVSVELKLLEENASVKLKLCSEAAVISENSGSKVFKPSPMTSGSGFLCGKVAGIAPQNNQVFSTSSEVRNVTKNTEYSATPLPEANPGDILEYKLIIRNTSEIDIENYTITNSIIDLLDYADLDLNFLVSRGGIYEVKSDEIRWENQTIPANKDVEKFFRITAKNKIPTTSQPSVLSSNYDCNIGNDFGSITVVEVSCPLSKTVENLPNTSQRNLLWFSITVLLIAVIFYSRESVIRKEISIAKLLYRQSEKK